MTESVVVPIDERVDEARDMVTLRFGWGRECEAGQFVMVWIPGVDEIPMSLSYLGERKGITVRRVGEATATLCSLKRGDRIRVRGPYGRGFSVGRGRTLIVAGGTGIAALAPFIESAGSEVDVALGATSQDLLFFEERFTRRAEIMRVSTDDGSRGFKGTVVELTVDMMEGRRYDGVVACGPERMLLALKDVCDRKGIDYQFSLERFMKCGAGLCGCCAVDGMRVCADGPVFHASEIRRMVEFGRWRRDSSGRRMPV